MDDRSELQAGEGARSIAPEASAIYLPRLAAPPSTILEYLGTRFPHVGIDTWRQRMLEGKVMGADDEIITPATVYGPDITIRYFREVVDEPSIPFEEQIIFRNEHFLIADKPHFLPVVPSGPYVNECLLFRLRRSTGLDAITPAHRLDRETAGLVLFALDPVTRPLYHALFAEGRIEKEYLAIGRGKGHLDDEFTIANRIVPGSPWFRMSIGEGEANAVTHIQVVERAGDQVLFQLNPRTGKKHQLRLHLLSIGFPILNDHVYPDVHQFAPYDFTNPLQLLAHRLAFIDPVSNKTVKFTSRRSLKILENNQESI